MHRTHSPLFPSLAHWAGHPQIPELPGSMALAGGGVGGRLHQEGVSRKMDFLYHFCILKYSWPLQVQPDLNVRTQWVLREQVKFRGVPWKNEQEAKGQMPLQVLKSLRSWAAVLQEQPNRQGWGRVLRKQKLQQREGSFLSYSPLLFCE